MELILEVQASGESKNRAHREPQGRNQVVDCADVDTTSLYGKLMALETYKKAYEDSVCGVYACERIAMKLRRGSTPAWIHEEDEYDMDLILEVQAELGELVGHHTRNGKVGSYNEYRNARLAADPELKAEYDALGPEYEQAQEEFQAYKKGLA